MKNIQEILSHLPLPYDKIKIQRCLKLLIKGLPIHYKNNILYMYLKGETLFIATKHQAINFELYQKLEDIQLMLSFIQKKTNKCKSITINELRCFSPDMKKKKQEEKKRKEQEKLRKEYEKFYIKKPVGNFKNLAKNKKIFEAFEKIREKIKNKNKEN